MRAARSKLSAQRLLGITTVAPEDCYAHPQDKQRVNLNTTLSVADIPSPIGTKEPARRYAGFYVFQSVFLVFYIGSSRSSDLSLMITPKILTYLIVFFIKFPHSVNMVRGVGSICLALECGRT